MAISTYGITLAWGATPYGLSKKIAIKDFPDLGGAPELLETTTLEDAMQVFILGIQSSGVMEYTGNYTKAEYTAINDDASTSLYYALSFGDGSVFRWQGQHTVYMTGKGVNEVVELKIAIAPSSKPAQSELGMLLVSCAEAAGVDETTVTVSADAASGFKYMYQAGATLTAPEYGDDLSLWTDLETNPDDIATTNGHIIGVALVDSTDELALAYGEATAVVA